MAELKEALEDPRDVSRKLVTEHLGAAFALAASLSVIVSFIYDWGFFSALGIDFSQAPTAISDHVRSWLIWLPFVITPVLVLLTHELLMSRLERGLTEEEIVASSRNPARARLIRNGPRKLISFMALLLLLLWLTFGEVFSKGRIIAFPITWMIFIHWVFRHPRMDARYSAVTKNIMAYVPAVFFVVFFVGAGTAHSEMSQSSKSHRIELAATQNGAGGQEVKLLRSFQDWILIRDDKGKVTWIRLNDVVRIQALEESKMFKGFVCLFSTSWCLSNIHGTETESGNSGLE